MSLRYLLDTNIVSSPVSPTPNRKILARLEACADRCAIPAPVWHELTFGCARLARGRRRSALEAYLREVLRPAFPIVPYDEDAAAWHGIERARLQRAGKPAPQVESQIAAIAHARGLAVVTQNTKDFAKFRGLELVDWSKQ